MGSGLSYVPAMTAAMHHYPNSFGKASGFAAAGFGAGVAVLPLSIHTIAPFFKTLPKYLGPVSEHDAYSIGDKLFAAVNEFPVEVIVAASDTVNHIAEGLYVVGSGASGISQSIAVTALLTSAVLFGTTKAFHYPTINTNPEDSLNSSIDANTEEENQQKVIATTTTLLPTLKDMQLLGAACVFTAVAGACLGPLATQICEVSYVMR